MRLKYIEFPVLFFHDLISESNHKCGDYRSVNRKNSLHAISTAVVIIALRKWLPSRYRDLMTRAFWKLSEQRSYLRVLCSAGR